MGLLKGLKWLAIGVIGGEIITGYLKDKKFRSDIDKSDGVDKLKTIGKYLYDTNKNIATDIKTKAEEFDANSIKQTVHKTVDQVKGSIDSIKSSLISRLHDIEEQVDRYYNNIKKGNIDGLTSNDKYREIASKISLYAKSLTKYIEEGIINIDDKLNLETRLAEISKKLKSIKK